MRLSTDEERDEERALETIAAAAEAGITVFDTARAYGREDDSATTSACSPARSARCGAEATRADRDERRHDAAGRRVDPGRPREGDPRRLRGEPGRARRPRRSTSTSSTRPIRARRGARRVRALARLADEGLVRRVGVANVNRRQLDEALELAPIAAVQVALSVFDDRALRGGVVERCAERGIAADRALAARRAAARGRPRAPRGARRGRRRTRRDAGRSRARLAARLSPAVVAIPGARRPETARSAARAATLVLDDGDREALDRAFGMPRPARSSAAARRRGGRRS